MPRFKCKSPQALYQHDLSPGAQVRCYASAIKTDGLAIPGTGSFTAWLGDQPSYDDADSPKKDKDNFQTAARTFRSSTILAWTPSAWTHGFGKVAPKYSPGLLQGNENGTLYRGRSTEPYEKTCKA